MSHKRRIYTIDLRGLETYIHPCAIYLHCAAPFVRTAEWRNTTHAVQQNSYLWYRKWVTAAYFLAFMLVCQHGELKECNSATQKEPADILQAETNLLFGLLKCLYFWWGDLVRLGEGKTLIACEVQDPITKLAVSCGMLKKVRVYYTCRETARRSGEIYIVLQHDMELIPLGSRIPHK